MRILAALPIALLAATPAFAAQPITGDWLTEDGKAVVTVAPCGGQLCGRVSRILATAPDTPRTDTNNPDPKLRGRPLKGLAVLSGFSEDGDKWRGSIYDPKTGKTYKSVVERAAADRLKVQGCVLFICKTQMWRRAS